MALLRRDRSHRDLWATPPGGAAPGTWRSHLKPALAFALAVSLGIGGAVTYASMKSSTAVSAEDALAEFNATSQARSVDGGKAEATATPKKQKREQRGEATKTRRRAGAVVAAGATGDDAAAATDAAQAPAEQTQTADTRSRRPAAATDAPRPQEGVYSWEVEGYEQAPGVRRDLPSRSHRVITHEGASAWTEHHIFSEEREQWMNLSVAPEGVTVTSVRNRVVMGPVTVDKTVTYNPAVFVARFPPKVGRTWEGSWSGRTSGEYTARTFDHTTLVIAGEEVEVWGSEVIMNMRGEVEGRVITRSWYAPKYRLVVKQYQNMDAKTGPGEYRSEWTGQVVSLQPQT